MSLDPDTYDVREVACPYCDAKKGSYCKRPSGHSGPFVYPHADRRKKAHKVWRKEELDKYGHIKSDFLKET